MLQAVGPYTFENPGARMSPPTSQDPGHGIRRWQAVPQADADRLVTAQHRREAARARQLTHLLHERPELAGVHPAADLVAESVSWCA